MQSQDGTGGIHAIKHAVAEGYWPRPVFGSIQAPFTQSQDGITIEQEVSQSVKVA